MPSIKEEAIKAISKLPGSADIDDIMYRLYVIDRVKKGQEAIRNGRFISPEKLKAEIKLW
ncbi:MAG: hypothetical protein ACE5GG_03180 [Candidatus Omnitrophota bacterium]